MAVAQSAYRSSINISNISKSASSFGKGIAQSRSSVAKVNNILLKKTRFKRQSIAGDRILFNKRREAVRRREQEDIIESSGISGAIKRQGKVIASSTKGFLGRIMDFVGTLMVGWLINNLPLIVKLGEQVIQRIQKLVSTLGGFVSGITQILSGFGSLLGGVVSDIVRFNFSNIGKDISTSMNRITSGFESIESSFDDAMDILKKPFDFEEPEIPQGGVLPREGQPTPSAQPQPSTSGGGGGGGGKWKPLLDLISSGEGGYTSIAPSDQNPNLTKMTIAEAANATGVKGGRGAIGRYQFTSPIQQAKAAGLNVNSDLFSQANQDKMAIAIIEKKRRGRDWLAGKITDEQFSEELAHEWGSFRSASGYVLPNNSGAIGFDKIKPTLQKVKATPAQTTTTATPSAPPPPPTGINPNKQIAVNSKVGATVKTSGFGMRWGKHHGGIDLGCSVGTYISCKYPCKVVEASSESGYGYYTDIIIPSLNIRLRFAHLSKQLIKSGDVPAGKPFAQSGNSGAKTTGPHIHMEATRNMNGTAYGGDFNPDPYVDAMIFSTNPPAGFVAPPVPTNTSAQITAPSTGSTKQMKAMTPERSGPTVVVAQPQAPQMQAPMGGGGGGQSMPNVSSGEIELNRLMTQRLLLELAYT
jgi:hypothetical protein